jgi:hypothetical protein
MSAVNATSRKTCVGGPNASAPTLHEGTLREHQPDHRRGRAVTRLRAIPSSCAAFVPAASPVCLRSPSRCSMVRSGRRFESVRGLQGPANRHVVLPHWARAYPLASTEVLRATHPQQQRSSRSRGSSRSRDSPRSVRLDPSRRIGRRTDWSRAGLSRRRASGGTPPTWADLA